MISNPFLNNDKKNQKNIFEPTSIVELFTIEIYLQNLKFLRFSENDLNNSEQSKVSLRLTFYKLRNMIKPELMNQYL